MGEEEEKAVQEDREGGEISESNIKWVETVNSTDHSTLPGSCSAIPALFSTDNKPIVSISLTLFFELWVMRCLIRDDMNLSYSQKLYWFVMLEHGFLVTSGQKTWHHALDFHKNFFEPGWSTSFCSPLPIFLIFFKLKSFSIAAFQNFHSIKMLSLLSLIIASGTVLRADTEVCYCRFQNSCHSSPSTQFISFLVSFLISNVFRTFQPNCLSNETLLTLKNSAVFPHFNHYNVVCLCDKKLRNPYLNK